MPSPALMIAAAMFCRTTSTVAHHYHIHFHDAPLLTVSSKVSPFETEDPEELEINSVWPIRFLCQLKRYAVRVEFS